jgi:ADP-heptose:LPS heptosyltransferase
MDPGKKGFTKWPDTNVYFQYPERKVLDTKHLTEWFCEQAGVPPSQDIYYPIDPNVWKTIEGVVGKVIGGRSYIVVHPYPGHYFGLATWGDYVVNRMWSIMKWRNLCQQLMTDGYKIIQVGGKGEEPLLKENHNFTCVAGKTTLKELAAIIKQARTMICLDSVTSHLSQAMKIRSVVLYGSSSPKLTGYVQNTNIFLGLECQPCYKTEICDHRTCLEGISVEQVYNAAISILKENEL